MGSRGVNFVEFPSDIESQSSELNENNKSTQRTRYLLDEARKLSYQLDNLLSDFWVRIEDFEKKISTNLDIAEDLYGNCERIEHDIGLSTRQLNELLVRLKKGGEAEGSVLKYHSTKLQDYRLEHKKVKEKLFSKSDLFREKILEHKRKKFHEEASTARRDNAIQANLSIQNSEQSLDQIIQSAMQSSLELANQRRTVENNVNQVSQMTFGIASTNSLIEKITSKKLRNTFILAAVISFCVGGLIWYSWTFRYSK